MNQKDHIYLVIPKIYIAHAGLICMIQNGILEYDKELGDWKYILEDEKLYTKEGKKIGRIVKDHPGIADLVGDIALYLEEKADQ